MSGIKSKAFAVFFGLFLFVFQAYASDININLVNLNPADKSRLQNAYSKTYGFSPAQIAPLLAGPATEIPLILQIAKSAGKLPLEIWSMRKLGLSYANILKQYALAPTVLLNPNVPYEKFGSLLEQVAAYKKQYQQNWPSNISLSDPVLIEMGKLKHFTHYAKIPANQIISLPTEPASFSHLVIEPTRPSPYFIPPGQAKKLGLWEPPGQAKKYEREDSEKQDRHHKKHKEDDNDFAFFKKKYEKYVKEEDREERDNKHQRDREDDDDHERHGHKK